MNYLDLTNNVLRRMRENTVTSLYANQQSAVVADLVNDAKRQVEDAHDWSCLQQDISVPTVAGQSEYSLPNTENRVTIMDVRNETNGSWLSYVSAKYIRGQNMVDNAGRTAPSYYAQSGVDANGDAKVKLWGIPDKIYDIKYHCVLREGDLTQEGSETAIPHQPIIHMAHYLAARERGDVDGADSAVLAGLAQKSLGNAIQYDMARQVENNIWYPA